MPNYRRNYVSGGTFFFTVVTHRRVPFLCTPAARRLLQRCIRQQREVRFFRIDAVVLLPDHLHMIWALPPGDADFSTRWAAIKGNFSRLWRRASRVGRPSDQQQAGFHRVWQPRFMEHTIRDEEDLLHHVEYIHYNPVKHGLASCPKDWRWSSFHRYVRLGAYPLDWGCSRQGPTLPAFAVDEKLLE